MRIRPSQKRPKSRHNTQIPIPDLVKISGFNDRDGIGPVFGESEGHC